MRSGINASCHRLDVMLTACSFLVIVLAGGYLLLNGSQALAVDRDPWPVSKFLQPWQEKPTLPSGWKEISRAEGYVAAKKNEKDVFVVAMDSANVVLFWFRKGKTYWEMLLVTSSPLRQFSEVKVNVKSLRVVIKDGGIAYGIDGRDAFAWYSWDEDKQALIGYHSN